MRFEKEDKDKKFICRNCGTFYDEHELIKGVCPECETDEYVYLNDLLNTDCSEE